MKIRNKYINRKNILKVALFGCGKMGMHHLQIIKSLPNAQLVGIADPRVNEQEINEITGSGVIVADTAENLLDSVKPDVVHIVTPPETHYHLGMLAINNGIHVYMEKPFSLQEEDAKEIIDTALERSLKICPGHQLLAHEATLRAEKTVTCIGEVVFAESYFSFRKVRKSLSDVDQLIDILPHPVYILLHFLNMGIPDAQFDLHDIVSIHEGEVAALIGCGSATAMLVVSLRGRPVESYLKLVGTNGSLHIDYVRGMAINLTGAGFDAIAAITNPYRQGGQIIGKATKSFIKMAMRKDKSYQGLSALIKKFHCSILKGTEPPVHFASALNTVRVCEQIGIALRKKEKALESAARIKLEEEERRLPLSYDKGRILITGGTGFLGKTLARKLRSKGWPIRVIARHMPAFSQRIPGVEYVIADLSEQSPYNFMRNVSAVVHCAAETSGGQADQKRNSIESTKNVLEAAGFLGIRKFVHISSLSVLKPNFNSEKLLDEASPVDSNNIGRGPYVWGKAQAEEVIHKMSSELGVEAKIIRLGPLVDFQKFEAPGRLGREVGTYFVVMGSKKSRLSICNVHTACTAIESYLSDYESAPDVLNLVEPESLSRQGLVAILLKERKDLKAVYIPVFLINLGSYALKGLQKIFFPTRKPLDIAAAFASEHYNTDLVKEVLRKTTIEHQSL